MKKSFLFITCEEAKHICDKSQYNESSAWERFKLNLRLSWCHITRGYVKRNRKLTKSIKNSNIDCLSPEQKSSMEKQFNKALSEKQQ